MLFCSFSTFSIIWLLNWHQSTILFNSYLSALFWLICIHFISVHLIINRINAKSNNSIEPIIIGKDNFEIKANILRTIFFGCGSCCCVWICSFSNSYAANILIMQSWDHFHQYISNFPNHTQIHPRSWPKFSPLYNNTGNILWI